MDRKYIEDEHIVARYLADQLTPAEAEAFEAYYTRHPSMVREIEYALRLKEGLATLQDRQELDALMRARKQRWSTPLSIAAAITVALVGGWAWYGSVRSAPVVPTLEELVATSSSPMPIGGKYLLVRLRSSNEDTLQIPLPANRSAIELQMLPTAGGEGAPYTVVLTRRSTGGPAADRGEQVGEAKGLSLGPDGLVTAWLDSARLEPGPHAVELIPSKVSDTLPADRFAIELR